MSLERHSLSRSEKARRSCCGRVQERSARLGGCHCRGPSGMVVSREARQPHRETQAAKEDRVSPWLGLRPHDFSSGCSEGHAPHASQGPEVGPWAGGRCGRLRTATRLPKAGPPHPCASLSLVPSSFPARSPAFHAQFFLPFLPSKSTPNTCLSGRKPLQGAPPLLPPALRGVQPGPPSHATRPASPPPPTQKSRQPGRNGAKRNKNILNSP